MPATLPAELHLRVKPFAVEALPRDLPGEVGPKRPVCGVHGAFLEDEALAALGVGGHDHLGDGAGELV